MGSLLGLSRTSASVSAISLVTGSPRSMGTAKGWLTYQGEGVYNSTRLPSGSKK